MMSKKELNNRRLGALAGINPYSDAFKINSPKGYPSNGERLIGSTPSSEDTLDSLEECDDN